MRILGVNRCAMVTRAGHPDFYELAEAAKAAWLAGAKRIRTDLVQNHEAAAFWNSVWTQARRLLVRKGALPVLFFAANIHAAPLLAWNPAPFPVNGYTVLHAGSSGAVDWQQDVAGTNYVVTNALALGVHQFSVSAFTNYPGGRLDSVANAPLRLTNAPAYQIQTLSGDSPAGPWTPLASQVFATPTNSAKFFRQKITATNLLQ